MSRKPFFIKKMTKNPNLLILSRHNIINGGFVMQKLKFYGSVIWLGLALICVFSGVNTITNWCLRNFYGRGI